MFRNFWTWTLHLKKIFGLWLDFAELGLDPDRKT